MTESSSKKRLSWPRMLSECSTRLHLWLAGRLVGSDDAGNRYYIQRRLPSQSAVRAGKKAWRSVLYADTPEASTIPPAWFMWLHDLSNELPSARVPAWPWQKQHKPNPTGTDQACMPCACLTQRGPKDAHRPRGLGDYVPWRIGV